MLFHFRARLRRTASDVDQTPVCRVGVPRPVPDTFAARRVSDKVVQGWILDGEGFLFIFGNSTCFALFHLLQLIGFFCCTGDPCAISDLSGVYVVVVFGRW